MAYKRITVLAAESQDDLEERGAKFEQACDTIKEAKATMRHVLSDEYARAAEMKQPFGYACITVDGEVHSSLEYA